MCGIVAVIGTRDAAPLLLDGLRQLEYRGYDSAGIATVHGGQLSHLRAEGKLINLTQRFEAKGAAGSCGIGHTRWATHGVPNYTNAHPQTSNSGNLVIVHNGIIENYDTLKQELESKGYKFRSDTDTEVLSYLISDIKEKTGYKLAKSVRLALEQVVGAESKYKRLIVSRPVQPMGKDIGFLPGDMQEKMIPWLMPIQDNLQYLMGDDRATLEMYVENGTIEIEALTYIRGRSISNAFIIIDECQNLSAHEIKTIITRVGEKTKIVFTGDIEQIDNIYTNETSNGLTYAIERFKTSHLSGHITFKKGERSKIATLASQLL